MVAIVLCLILSFFLQECKDSVTGYSLIDLETVIPLKVGSSWTYLDIIPSSLPTFPADSELVNSEVYGYLDYANVRIYTMNGFIGEGDSARYYESVTQTRYQRYREDEDGKRAVIATLLQTPVKRGNRWFFNGVDNSSGYAEITNPDTTVEIASGTFSGVICVRQLAVNGNTWLIKPTTGIVFETHFIDVMVTRQLMETHF